MRGLSSVSSFFHVDGFRLYVEARDARRHVIASPRKLRFAR